MNPETNIRRVELYATAHGVSILQACQDLADIREARLAVAALLRGILR